MGLWSKLIKGGTAAVKGAKTIKTVKVSNVGVKTAGALSGLTAFFGLEWLTNGGLQDGVAGALGIPEWMASLLLISVSVCIGGVVILTLANRLGVRIPASRRR